MNIREASIIAKLHELCPTAKRIELATSLKDVPDLDNDIPALFVVEVDDECEPPEMLNSSRQFVNAQIIVQIAAPEADIETMKQGVLGLKKFIPAGCQQKMIRTKGGLIDVKPNLHWHIYQFQASYYEP